MRGISGQHRCDVRAGHADRRLLYRWRVSGRRAVLKHRRSSLTHQHERGRNSSQLQLSVKVRHNLRRPKPFSDAEDGMRFGTSVMVGILAVYGCGSSTDPFVPGCLKVQGTFDPRSPLFIVEYRRGVDAVKTTADLSAKYSFSPKTIYETLPGFAAELSKRAVAGISC